MYSLLAPSPLSCGLVTLPLLPSQGFPLPPDLFRFPCLTFLQQLPQTPEHTRAVLSAAQGCSSFGLATAKFLRSWSSSLPFCALWDVTSKLPLGSLSTLVWALGSRFLLSPWDGEFIPMSTSAPQGFHSKNIQGEGPDFEIQTAFVTLG